MPSRGSGGENTRRAALSSRPFRWAPWLVFLVGAAAALTIASLEYRLEIGRERAHFTALANDRMELLSNEARTLVRPVRHLAAVLTFTGGEISEAEFNNTVQSIPLMQHPVLLGLQWHTAIEDTGAFLMQHCYCPHGDAPTRQVALSLIQHAARGDRIWLSSWYEAGGQIRLQALRPVFRDNGSGAPLGFVLGVYRVDGLIETALERVAEAPVEVYVRDAGSPSAGVFGYSNGEVRYIGTEFPQSVERPHLSEVVALYGGPGHNLASWETLVIATEGSFRPDPWPPLVSALIGLAFSALLAVHMRGLQSREKKVSDLVIKRTEELYRREQEFENLAEGNPDMIARVDRQLRYRYVNSAIARFFGPPREAFIGKQLGSLGLPADVAAEVTQSAKAAFRTGKAEYSEHRLVTPAGERCFDARFLPEKDTEGHSETLLLVARDITVQKRLQHELEQLTLRDPLTGIANRRFLAQFREHGWRYEARHKHDVAVILADLDYFKAYNDRYGHPQGDECLRQVASALQKALHRATDTLVRYGGEEFAIILPDTGKVAVQQLAERLRVAVQRLRLPHAGSPFGIVTLSLGAAAAKANETEFDDLIASADEALYRAKNRGRDRSQCAADD